MFPWRQKSVLVKANCLCSNSKLYWKIWLLPINHTAPVWWSFYEDVARCKYEPQGAWHATQEMFYDGYLLLEEKENKIYIVIQVANNLTGSNCCPFFYPQTSHLCPAGYVLSRIQFPQSTHPPSSSFACFLCFTEVLGTRCIIHLSWDNFFTASVKE